MALERSKPVQDDSLTPPDSSEALPLPRAPADQGFAKSHQLNQYIVLERLGSGGQGVVYAAYDSRVDRKVALKMLRSDLHSQAPAQASAQLLKEAQTLGKLKHPNVVPVHGIESVPGCEFIVMGFMSEGTLADWAKKAPRSLEDVLARFREAGRGLAAAHAVGVVHRDFKPENVLLDEGVAHVTDFGLARELNHTSAGVAGTWRYMAPEQRARAAVGPAADQYAFCMSLFHVLTGAWPFEDEGPRVVRFPPADTTPPWVRAIITRGLSSEPSARYPSMGELLERLAADPTTQRRKVWRTAALVTLIAGTAAAAGAFAFTESPSQRAERRCLEKLEQTHATIWLPPRVQQIQDAFRAVAGDLGVQTFERVRGRMEPEVAAWRRESSAACKLEDRVSSRVLSRCLLARGQTLVSLSESFAHADRAAVEASVHTLGLEMQPVSGCQTSASTPPQLEDGAADERLRPSLARARVLRALGRLADAKQSAQLAAEEAEDAGAVRVAAEARLLAGQLAAELREEGAERRLHFAIVSAEAVGADEQRAQAWMALIAFHADRRDFEQARFALTQAEAIVERLGSPELLDSELSNQRGRLLAQQGDAEGAHRAFIRALELLRKHRPEDDARVMRALNNSLVSSPDAPAAIEGLRALVKARERTLGSDHPETALTQDNLAERLQREGHCEEAEVEVRGSIERRLRAGEPNPMRVGRGYSLLARVLKCRSRVPESIAAERKAIELFEQGHEDPVRLRPELNFLLARLVEASEPQQEQELIRQKLTQLPFPLGEGRGEGVTKPR